MQEVILFCSILLTHYSLTFASAKIKLEINHFAIKVAVLCLCVVVIVCGCLFLFCYVLFLVVGGGGFVHFGQIALDVVLIWQHNLASRYHCIIIKAANY